jgi:Cu+-exporting ATPase
MTCVSCVSHLTRALRRVDGVRAVKIDLRGETATVERDPLLASDALLACAIVKAGYGVDLASLTRLEVAPRRNWLFWNR